MQVVLEKTRVVSRKKVGVKAWYNGKQVEVWFKRNRLDGSSATIINPNRETGSGGFISGKVYQGPNLEPYFVANKPV